jgi:hypothetical protein
VWDWCVQGYSLLVAGVLRLCTEVYGKVCAKVRKVLRTTGAERIDERVGSTEVVKKSRVSTK